MLYKFMSYLFGNNDAYRYTPKPFHLVYSLLLLGVGTVTIRQGWIFFGVMSNIFGVVLGVTIILGMNWDKAIEYWDSIANVFDKATRIKDATTRYELLKSMGWKVLPSSVEVIETERDDNGIFGMMKHGIPISPAIMQVIADKVLMSGNTSFTEPQYKSIIPNYRKAQKHLRDNKYITKTKDGYVFNKKGIDVLYEYASDGIKIELERRKK